MHVQSRGVPLGALAMVSLLAFTAAMAETKEGLVETLTGQPADLSGSAYPYRADRKPDENPPESWLGLMQYAGLPFDKKPDLNTPVLKKVLCSLLWEEVRPVRKVELTWPADAKNVPAPADLKVVVADGNDAKAHVLFAECGKQEVSLPESSADGRTLTYKLPVDTWSIVVAVRGEKDASTFAVPAIRAFGAEAWKKLAVEIEWGFDNDKDYSGRIEAYDGVVAGLKALDAATAVDRQAWTSPRKGEGRRGVALTLFYVGQKGASPFGHQPMGVSKGVSRPIEEHHAYRTLVTLWTKAGNFTFQADDLERGPLLAPEFGFYVCPAGAATAAEFRKELAAKGLKTVRERVHARAEPTWESVMREYWGDTPLPPLRAPALHSPMQIEVPCARMTAQWNLAGDHLFKKADPLLTGQDEKSRTINSNHTLNPILRGPDGKWLFNDTPYGINGSEVQVILRALDLLGYHKEAADGCDQWLSLPADPGKPDGLFSDGLGCFTHAKGAKGVGGDMDGAHGGGPGMIAFAIHEHYRVTGDAEGLKKNVARMQANADWISRQRRWVASLVPGGDRLWGKGLLPPHQLSGDRTCGAGHFLQWYCADAFAVAALENLAEMLGDAGLAAEAAAYRADLKAAVERSIALSPVMQSRDGQYRSWIPMGPYVRGLASGAWSWKRGKSVYTNFDTIWTTQVLYPGRVLAADDPRNRGYLDTMEDRVTLELPTKKNCGGTQSANYRPPDFPDAILGKLMAGYDPEKDWYAFAGFNALLAWEAMPNAYLDNDDIPSFLRSFYTYYGSTVCPLRDYTFFECPLMRAGPNKFFEEAGFLLRFRNLLAMELGDALWLARGTPRAWLEQGKRIAVKNAPTHFGSLTYEIVSDADNGKISATVEVPSRKAPNEIVLRLRHPKSARMVSVMVNGKPWTEFDKERETIVLKGLTRTVVVSVQY